MTVKKVVASKLGKSARVAAAADTETRAMIYEGCNMSQLSVIFHQNVKDLARKMYGITPCGTRSGVPIYAIHEVAPYVVKPQYDIEAYIKKMHHNDLPKLLTKEFWAGQRSKQEFLLREGDLWPTAKVISEVGELFKLLKMQLRLTLDTVERQTELSQKQRDIIKSLLDGTLKDLHQAVSEKFKARENGESDGSVLPEKQQNVEIPISDNEATSDDPL